MTDEFPLYVREEAARLAILRPRDGKFSPHYTAANVASYRLGRALCQVLLETMPVPVDPLEAVLDAVLDIYHYPAISMEGRRNNALSTLRCELEARGWKEPLT